MLLYRKRGRGETRDKGSCFESENLIAGPKYSLFVILDIGPNNPQLLTDNPANFVWVSFIGLCAFRRFCRRLTAVFYRPH